MGGCSTLLCLAILISVFLLTKASFRIKRCGMLAWAAAAVDFLTQFAWTAFS